MPTYAYACKSCDHRFDAVQSFSEPALTDCPECGGPLRKEYGSIGVTFNGSGFYRTDSRAGDGANGGSSGTNVSQGNSGTDSSSTSSKSDTTSSPAAAG